MWKLDPIIYFWHDHTKFIYFWPMTKIITGCGILNFNYFLSEKCGNGNVLKVGALFSIQSILTCRLTLFSGYELYYSDSPVGLATAAAVEPNKLPLWVVLPVNPNPVAGLDVADPPNKLLVCVGGAPNALGLLVAAPKKLPPPVPVVPVPNPNPPVGGLAAINGENY